MKESNYRDKAVNGFVWSFLERCGAQGVTLIVSVILARLLEPSVYGVVAMCNVIIAMLAIFINKGLSSALIQKKQPDDLDFSSMFYFNIGLSLILYVIVFGIAGYIAQFLNMPELKWLIRVSGIELVISSVKSVEYAYVSKNMLFKKFFYATLGGTIGAAAVGIYMAYSGYGAWALVIQALFNTTVDTIILWFTVKWRPKRVFSWKRLKTLFQYGWKVLVTSLLDSGYERIRQVIVGKLYTAADLAFYNKGQAYPSMLMSNIGEGLNGVLLPSMSAVQDDKYSIRNMVRRANKLGTYIVVPLLAGLGACATSFVEVVFTAKWLPCVPYIRIFCFTYAFYPTHTANLNAIKALGRSDLFLKLECLKKSIGIVLMIISIQFGPLAIAYSFLFGSILGSFINAWPNRKLIAYKCREQVKDISPAFLLSLFMAMVVYAIQLLSLNAIATLFLQIIVGIVIYLLGSKFLNIDSYYYLIDILKTKILNKKKSNR